MKFIIAGVVILVIILLVQFMVPLTLVGPDDGTMAIHIYSAKDGSAYYVSHANTHIELSSTRYEAGQAPMVTASTVTLTHGSHSAPSATGWVVTISGYDYLWYKNGLNANSLLFNSCNAQIGPSGMDNPMNIPTSSQQFPNPSSLVAGDHVEVRLVLEISASGLCPYADGSGASVGDTSPFESYGAGYGTEIVEHINQLPIVTATASPQSGYAPLTVQLSGTATDDGAITSYEWNFGDGSDPVTGRVDWTHTYTNTGTFIATFTVVDDEGGTGSDSVTIKVNAGGTNKPPTASASASPTSGQAPLSVSFSASSDDPDGNIISNNWDFGDGATSSIKSPQHTYQVAGTYTAVFSAVDNEGATASDSVTITVTQAYVPPDDDDDDDDDDDEEETTNWLWPSLIIIGAVVLALILWAGGGLIGGIIGIIIIILAAIASLLMFLGVI